MKTNFFKTTAFKCIAVLLSIALICAGGLAILSNVLEVSSEERTNRAMEKIYGKKVEATQEKVDDKIDVSKYGKIENIYYVEEEGDYVFKSTGYEGYKNGTITVWVQYHIEDEKINKVLLESYEKQTLMSKLDGSFYDKFLVDISDCFDESGNIKDGYAFSPKNTKQSNFNNPVSGATYSATAGCNAVNAVILYIGKMGV